MQTIDEARLESDTTYRFEYLREFLEFGPEDVAAVRAVMMPLAKRIPQLVDATYRKLLSYDATARHFLERQQGYDGPLPGGLANLSLDDPQIRFRKEHLQRYLMHLLGHTGDAKLPAYLDMVGKIHTPLAGNPQIDVPLVQMNALLGLLADILTTTIFEFDLALEIRLRAVRAFHKLLWLQSDFVSRHYVATK